MLGVIRTGLVAVLGCLLLCGCPSTRPGPAGTVADDTGGRGGNTIIVTGGGIFRLYVDDDEFDNNVFQPTQTVAIRHIGKKMTVAPADGSAMPAWLTASPFVDTSVYDVTTNLTFHPQKPEPYGEEAILRFTASDPDGSHAVYQDVIVYAYREMLVSSRRQMLTYTLGGAVPPAIHLDITAGGDWSAQYAVDTPPWSAAAPLTGTGNGGIDITLTPQQLAEGDYLSGTFITDSISHRQKAFGLYLGVDPRRLETDRQALAFSSTPAAARLTRELRILDTAGLDGHWKVSDDASWLSASAAAGAGSATLTLTADPTGLPDGFHTATLTVSPDNEPGFTNDATVQIGLYVDHVNTGPSVALAGAATTAALLAADPLRPRVYGLTNQGDNSTLHAWNVYTGAEIDSLALPGVTASRVHVSPDGAMLMVTDIPHKQFIPVRLDTAPLAPGAAWTGMRILAGFDDFAFARLNGVTAIAWSVGQVLSMPSGVVVTNYFDNLPQYPFLVSPTAPPIIAVAPADARRGCRVLREASGSSFEYLALGYRAGKYSAVASQPVTLVGDVSTCLLDPTGTHVYVATNDKLYRFDWQARKPGVEQAIARGGSLQQVADGTIYLASEDGSWTHFDADLGLIANHAVAGGAPGGLLSGDEMRVLELTNDGSQLSGIFRNRDF